MKVKVVEKEYTQVSVRSLNVGDGFIFDGAPHVIATALDVGFEKQWLYAFNLKKSNMILLPEDQQVNLASIEIAYNKY